MLHSRGRALSSGMHRLWFRILPLVLLLSGCHTAPSSESQKATLAVSGSATSSQAKRNLDLDEAAGGHVLRKHVGRSDDELRERLRHDRYISAASSYTDRDTAERAIAAAISQQQTKIERWLARSGGHANLVLDYDSDQPIGRSLDRGDDRPRPCSHAVVVLKWIPPSAYYVLTSYPECRK